MGKNSITPTLRRKQKQGLASPEGTTEHRQAVKRSETPAMCRKLTECRRYVR